MLLLNRKIEIQDMWSLLKHTGLCFHFWPTDDCSQGDLLDINEEGAGLLLGL